MFDRNPFTLKPYVSKELFCDRKKELKDLAINIENGSNVTIISPRRMGKTGLILRYFDDIQERNVGIRTCYVDVMETGSLEDFVKTIAESVMRSFPESTSIGEKFWKFIKGLRPQIGFDSITSEPQISITYQNQGEKERTLDGILQFLENQDEPILLAIDEFQQIRQYPEKNIEAMLRTRIQHLKNVSFIFSGSQRNMMADMFFSPKSPFFASTQNLTIGKVAEKEYRLFITEQFNRNDREIDDEALEFVLQWSRRHTFYTQKLCNRIYAEGYKRIGIDEAKLAARHILEENAEYFSQYKRLLTDGQWNYLKAIAEEGEVTQPMAGTFIRKYDIGTPANSRRLLQALIDKELILDTITNEGTSYSVYDVFLSHHLESLD